ncbi:hypothetical protein BASA81_004501 [Batrachochytrium salamandrivorans]|nr:hypothetical protein BASA81_004501 [Batrachochytrium salamandrivorans]
MLASDAALERFGQLRARDVRAGYDQTAFAFQAKFQSVAASLEPDERLKLEVASTREGVKLLKAVLADPQAYKICALHWEYDGKEDVNSIVPLLINNCPELASLVVDFNEFSVFDFVSSMLDHPSNKIKVLALPRDTKGNIPRLFAALGQSKVSALTLFSGGSPEVAQDLHEYLARDLLVRLKVWMGRKQVPSEMMMSLAKCTRLVELGMLYCEFSQPTAFTRLPKSITTLTLNECTFVGGFDWSFLAGSNVRELNLHDVRGVDGNQLGSALAVHLKVKGLDKLHFYDCDFVDETLAVIGVDVGRIKRLMLEGGRVSDASIELIALALKSPNNEMKELKVECAGSTMSGIKDHLVPALKHPNCNLAKLSLRAYRDREAAGRVEAMFRNRLALFVLLQGKQVRRRRAQPRHRSRRAGTQLMLGQAEESWCRETGKVRNQRVSPYGQLARRWSTTPIVLVFHQVGCAVSHQAVGVGGPRGHDWNARRVSLDTACEMLGLVA